MVFDFTYSGLIKESYKKNNSSGSSNSEKNNNTSEIIKKEYENYKSKKSSGKNNNRTHKSSSGGGKVEGRIVYGYTDKDKGETVVIKKNDGSITKKTYRELSNNNIIVDDVVYNKSEVLKNVREKYDFKSQLNNLKKNNNNINNGVFFENYKVIEPAKKKNTFEKAKDNFLYFPELVSEKSRSLPDKAEYVPEKMLLGGVYGLSIIPYSIGRETYNYFSETNRKVKESKGKGFLAYSKSVLFDSNPAVYTYNKVKNFDVWSFGAGVGRGLAMDPVFTVSSFISPEVGLYGLGRASTFVKTIGKEKVPYSALGGPEEGFALSNVKPKILEKQFKNNKFLNTVNKDFKSGGFHFTTSKMPKELKVGLGKSEYSGLYISTVPNTPFSRIKGENTFLNYYSDISFFPSKSVKPELLAIESPVGRLPKSLRSDVAGKTRSGSVFDWEKKASKHPAVKFLLKDENSKNKAWITPKYEVGVKSGGYREPEAVIPTGSVLKQEKVSFWNRFTGGSNKYTVYKGHFIPLKEYRVGSFDNSFKIFKSDRESVVGNFKFLDSDFYFKKLEGKKGFRSKTYYEGSLKDYYGPKTSYGGLSFRSGVVGSSYSGSFFENNNYYFKGKNSKNSFFDSVLKPKKNSSDSFFSNSGVSDSFVPNFFSGGSGSGGGSSFFPVSGKSYFSPGSSFTFNFGFFDNSKPPKIKLKKNKKKEDKSFFGFDSLGFSPKYTESAIVKLGFVKKKKKKRKNSKKSKSAVRFNPFEIRF